MDSPAQLLLPMVPEQASHEAQVLVLAQRMLRRLPSSLWDQALETPQGLLYQAIAGELTLWLDAWALVRQCTLLQQADGIDLDVLLRDYALKRYNQRPDAYARQLGRQILWTPKGTLYAIQEVAQLLTDSPQMCARSGRWQPHWWVAMNRPVRQARTYWQLGDVQGMIWYLALEENSVVLTQMPPPGANITPWPDGVTPVPTVTSQMFAGGREDVQSLYWFRAQEPLGSYWYISVGTGGVLALTRERPSPDVGTTQTCQLHDGLGEVWGIEVDEVSHCVSVIPLSTPILNATYWQVHDTDGVEWLLYVDTGTLVLAQPPAPLSWVAETPTGNTPLDWWALEHPGDGVVRYVRVLPEQVFDITDTEPAGIGTSDPMILRDIETTQLWRGGLDLTERGIQLAPEPEPSVISGAPLTMLDPGYTAQYFVLDDQDATPWHIWRSPVEFSVSDTAPLGHANVTPTGGPFTWWYLRDIYANGWAVSVDMPDLCLAVAPDAPDGAGTDAPLGMGDDNETLWHFGIAPDGSLGMSDWPALDFAQAATCLIVNDDVSARWYWRMDAETCELVCSAALEPDVIPYQRVGELGFLRTPDPLGHIPWYISADDDPCVRVNHAPTLGQPWGLDALDGPMLDIKGIIWRLTVREDGSIRPLPVAWEDIPQIPPILIVRDCIDAMRHVEGSGSRTTLWAS